MIDKARLKQRFKTPEHPFHLALQFGLKRLQKFLKADAAADQGGVVFCETRGKKEDRGSELAFRRVCGGDNFEGQRYATKLLSLTR